MKQAEVVGEATHRSLAGDRIVILDALRGITAIGVAAFHAYGFTWDRSVRSQYSLDMLGTLLHFCSVILVPSFYWLSGFVIAFSQSNGVHDTKSGLSFLTRRLVRVTPMWWISILFSIVFELVFDLKHNAPVRLPTLTQVVANATYSNFIFGIDSLNFPGYSLCLEVQMYALLTLILTLSIFIQKHLTIEISHWLILGCSIVSVIVSPNIQGLSWLFISWPWFALGYFSYLRANRMVSSDWTLACALPMLLSLLLSAQDDRLWVTVTTITVFVCLSEIQIGHRFWYMGKVLTYLGTISFPLYLLHIKFVAHAITFDKARQFLGLPTNATFFIIVILPLLLAIAITPLMNRIDKLLMAKLFPKKVISGQ